MNLLAGVSLVLPLRSPQSMTEQRLLKRAGIRRSQLLGLGIEPNCKLHTGPSAWVKKLSLECPGPAEKPWLPGGDGEYHEADPPTNHPGWVTWW